MDNTEQQPTIKVYPFYIKTPVILLGLVTFFFILFILTDVLVPLAMSCLFAILLNPLVNRLQKKLPRGIAIAISLATGILFVAAIIYFLSHEIVAFSKSIPALKAKSLMFAGQLQHWVDDQFGIAIEKQLAMVKSAVQNGGVSFSATLGGMLGVACILVLMPIYMFLLLFYKPLILDFLFNVFSEKYSLRVAEILGEVKTAIQSYIIGLLIEMVIVSAMNSAALMILGVRSAILLGVIGGILNMIPYLGGLVAIALPLLMATITKDGYTTQLAILGAYLVIQFIDNNILVPKIVSSKVKINALVSIIIVLMGGRTVGAFRYVPFYSLHSHSQDHI
ncbi:AI-2E family transporter [Flavipsychrobacter stenotrophus]|uniref:AI-2E family transporter n=1 Tax=Flavipsychrobacter stenotrophus TaxID=2077091 RepID=UPI001F0C9239|nr:AI-2E family transporter [Flavipsychrobacter stenotrophus]